MYPLVSLAVVYYSNFHQASIFKTLSMLIKCVVLVVEEVLLDLTYRTSIPSHKHEQHPISKFRQRRIEAGKFVVQT